VYMLFFTEIFHLLVEQTNFTWKTHNMATSRDSDNYTPPLQQDHDMLCFPHFADNSQKPNKSEQYDPLRNLRTVFDTMNKAYRLILNSITPQSIRQWMR
jgi:hypothetical protein